MVQNLRIPLIKMSMSSKQLFVRHLSRSIVRMERFLSSQKRLLPARRCKSSIQTNTPSLALIQPLNFVFYKIQSVLNIMMTVDSLFLLKAALLSICLLLKPLSSKLPTPTSADKRVRVQLKNYALITLSHWSFPANHGSAFY